MKHINHFNGFLNERLLGHIPRLVDTLVNSMEFFDEDSFMDLADEMPVDAEVLKDIYNGYWEVNPMDRMNWDTREWAKWLKKEYGVK